MPEVTLVYEGTKDQCDTIALSASQDGAVIIERGNAVRERDAFKAIASEWKRWFMLLMGISKTIQRKPKVSS